MNFPGNDCMNRLTMTSPPYSQSSIFSGPRIRDALKLKRFRVLNPPDAHSDAPEDKVRDRDPIFPYDR